MTNKPIETIIAELRELEAKATAGPWEADDQGEYIFCHSHMTAIMAGYIPLTTVFRHSHDEVRRMQKANVMFISAARNHIPALLDHIAALEAEIERLSAGQDNPNPLTLEELRERDGMPVFTKTIGVIGSGRWELLSFDDHWLYLKTAHERYKMTIRELEESYGKTWLAYDRPPKEDDE